MPDDTVDILDIEVTDDPTGALVLVLRGDVCLLSAARFGSVLGAAVEASRTGVVVDLGGVGVFGGAALGQLAENLALATALERTVLVRNPRPLHRTVLAATGFRGVVDVPERAPQAATTS